MKKVSARIYGIVQHVGFRNFVKRNADKLNITGWVRNSLDGTVEAVFEGDDVAISDIVEKCKKGPVLAIVEKVDVMEQEPNKEFDEFHIFR